MAKTGFSYSDHTSGAVHLTPLLSSDVTLFTPGDLETQPLFLRRPTPADACAGLEVGADPVVVLDVMPNPSATLEIGSGADATLEIGQTPSVTLEIGATPSATLEIGECEV